MPRRRRKPRPTCPPDTFHALRRTLRVVARPEGKDLLGEEAVAVVVLALLVGRGSASYEPGNSLLFTNAQLIDGTGTPGRVADLRVRGDRIVEIGDLKLERDLRPSSRRLTPLFV